MVHYSNEPYHVRGDLFTETGKWKYTVQIDMRGEFHVIDLHRAVVRAARATPSETLGVMDGAVGPESRYWLVVLDPYHQNAHPQMIKLSRYDTDLNYHFEEQ